MQDQKIQIFFIFPIAYPENLDMVISIEQPLGTKQMHTTITASRITFFKTYEAAAKLAAANQADDDSASYRVEEGHLGFFVAVYEDGARNTL